MVFGRIFVVRGIQVDLETAKEICSNLDYQLLDEGDSETPEQGLVAIDKNRRRCLEVFRLPGCCSGNSSNVFLFGFKVHTLTRVSKRCNACEAADRQCENCFRTTNGGRYPVRDMVDKFVHVGDDRICPTCFCPQGDTDDAQCRLCKCKYEPSKSRFAPISIKF